MLKDVDPNSKKIAAMLEKKSQLVLKKFRQVAISDIENPR